ncbi:MAG: hypothetical protein KDD37_11430 [Bdellovibrionales bacterium]|nr:hypothetical protein [Bdellovibrionales bacterium]
MGISDVYFKVAVLLGLIRASRYHINTPTVCASIWFVTRLSSGFLSRQKLAFDIFESILSFGFSWWMFNLLKRYDRWTMQWIGISGIGIVVLCYFL